MHMCHGEGKGRGILWLILLPLPLHFWCDEDRPRLFEEIEFLSLETWNQLGKDPLQDRLLHLSCMIKRERRRRGVIELRSIYVTRELWPQNKDITDSVA